MTGCFADTFYFLALLSPGDRAHQRAVALTARLPRPLVTTSWVLTEVADAMAGTRSRAAFIVLLSELRADPDVELIPPDPILFELGIDLYSRRPDKAWSLTDCISFVVMTQRQITDALTGDHHFEQAGFRALLREPTTPKDRR